jgi:lysozyme
LQPGDLVVLDQEDERAANGGAYGSIANWSLGWLQYVEAVLGFAPLVYTGPWYVNRPGWGPAPAELAQYGLWLAAYQATMPRPPAPWSFVAIWQHTSSGRVPGIDGDVDLNVFNGPRERLSLYGKPGGVVEPEPPIPAPADTRIPRALALLKQAVAILEEA